MPGSTETNWAVELIDVHKTYGRRVRALAGVDVRVGRGEIFGLLGPNGAGKSTLVKILMTLVRPDRASGTLLAEPLGARSALARVGYLPEAHRFPGHLNARQLLGFYAALARVPRVVRRKRAAELLKRVGLTGWEHVRISKYSKGMLQRLGLAQALMNDPQMVVLDEPTDGLDPLGRRDVRQILAQMKAAGKTVFLNSHLLSEVEMICDRVAILVNGRVARHGTVADLTAEGGVYRLTTTQPVPNADPELERLGARADGRTIELKGHAPEPINQVIDLLRQRGMLIESVIPHRFSLEDIFVQATRELAEKQGNLQPQDAL